MNKNIFILPFAIFLLGIICAAPLSSVIELDENNLSITITENQTTVEFYFDTSSLDEIETEYGDFPVSEILGGINEIQTKIDDGKVIFEKVDLSGIVEIEDFEISEGVTVDLSSPLYNVLNLLTQQTTGINYNFSEDSIKNAEILNNLTEDAESYINETVNFAKEGNDYYIISYGEGFGDVPEEYPTKINEIIGKYSKVSFNIKALIENYIFPNLEESLGLEDILNLNDFDYDVSVGELSTYISKLEDGSYEIPVSFDVGEVEIDKIVYVTLNGIPSSQDVSLSGEASQYISEIKGLPFGAVITAEILEVTEATNGTTLTNLKPLMVIEINSTIDGQGEIYFSINKSLVSNKDKISLYVLEGTSWTKLTTTYLDETEDAYRYSAITPHFSIFMIGEDTTPAVTPSNGGGSRRSRGGGGSGAIVDNSVSVNNNNEEDTSVPIVNNTPQQKSILQQILEFLGLTGRVTDDGEYVEGNPLPIILTFSSFILLVGILIVLKAKGISIKKKRK